jgi:hypothetical protein
MAFGTGASNADAGAYRARILVRKDCRSEFLFDQREQKYFATRVFQDPASCCVCREKWKAARLVSSVYLECSDCRNRLHQDSPDVREAVVGAGKGDEMEDFVLNAINERLRKLDPQLLDVIKEHIRKSEPELETDERAFHFAVVLIAACFLADTFSADSSSMIQ